METKQACKSLGLVLCFGYFLGLDYSKEKIKHQFNLSTVLSLAGAAIAENPELFKKCFLLAKKLSEEHPVYSQAREAILAIAEDPQRAYEILLEMFKEVR